MLDILAERKKLAAATSTAVAVTTPNSAPVLTVSQRVRNLSSLIADFRILLRILGIFFFSAVVVNVTIMSLLSLLLSLLQQLLMLLLLLLLLF